MRKLITLLILTTLSLTSYANSGKPTRATVEGASLKVVGENIDTIVDMDFCAGTYQGVAAIIWDDYMYNVLSRHICAESAKDCVALDRMWNQKVNPDDQRLPTMLLVYNPDKATKSMKQSAHRYMVENLGYTNKRLVDSASSAKIIASDEKPGESSVAMLETEGGMIVISACGQSHPPSHE
jgi:hypothetical protein